MVVNESVSMVLSTVVTHLIGRPRSFFYRNLWNFWRSTLLRLPWITTVARIKFDRFYYMEHNCTRVFHACRTKEADHIKSGGRMESSWLAMVEHYLPYLRRHTVTNCIRVHAVLSNLHSVVLEWYKGIFIDDLVIMYCFCKVQNCPFDNCAMSLQSTDEQMRAILESYILRDTEEVTWPTEYEVRPFYLDESNVDVDVALEEDEEVLRFGVASNR